MQDDHNDRDDEEKVDQSPGYVEEQADEPESDKDDTNDGEHGKVRIAH
jgi:hypothetical protein